ncbi:hypothetical protein [Paraburkholderia azotifigens]|uniref:Uncharacterized protein n=1 Tax=Paraburkholderia azotifigens TaxID=2057004 RepID=A0ABU9R354_9BURK
MGSKTIWVVNYDDVQKFLEKVVEIGATSVAIRTDNDMLKAIKAFHQVGIKVFGWRWPAVFKDPAMNEAKKVVALLEQGLDGYFVDPEGDRDEKHKRINWDQSNLEKLAANFCESIVSTQAATGKPFGVTSHYRANLVFPKLPWHAFFKHATVFLPQAYWRTGHGIVGHGDPADNYARSIEAWSNAGAPSDVIVPMAGELSHSSAAEIDQYVAAAKSHKIKDLHFYAYEKSVTKDVWDAVARAEV